MSKEERIKWEQELQDDARRESYDNMLHEVAMTEDVDYAAQYIQSQLTNDWINTYHFLKKECYRYGVDHQDLLDNL